MRSQAYQAAIAALEPLDDPTTRRIVASLRRELLEQSCPDLMLRCEMPIFVVSEANTASHEHWRVRHRRTKDQRGTASILAQSAWRKTRPPPPPLLISLTVLSQRKQQLDDDNLPVSCKAIRDGIADWLGVDDGDERLVWHYDQQKHPVPGKFGVLVTIHGRSQGHG